MDIDLSALEQILPSQIDTQLFQTMRVAVLAPEAYTSTRYLTHWGIDTRNSSRGGDFTFLSCIPRVAIPGNTRLPETAEPTRNSNPVEIDLEIQMGWFLDGVRLYNPRAFVVKVKEAIGVDEWIENPNDHPNTATQPRRVSGLRGRVVGYEGEVAGVFLYGNRHSISERGRWTYHFTRIDVRMRTDLFNRIFDDMQENMITTAEPAPK